MARCVPPPTSYAQIARELLFHQQIQSPANAHDEPIQGKFDECRSWSPNHLESHNHYDWSGASFRYVYASYWGSCLLKRLLLSVVPSFDVCDFFWHQSECAYILHFLHL